MSITVSNRELVALYILGIRKVEAGDIPPPSAIIAVMKQAIALAKYVDILEPALEMAADLLMVAGNELLKDAVDKPDDKYSSAAMDAIKKAMGKKNKKAVWIRKSDKLEVEYIDTGYLQPNGVPHATYRVHGRMLVQELTQFLQQFEPNFKQVA